MHGVFPSECSSLAVSPRLFPACLLQQHRSVTVAMVIKGRGFTSCPSVFLSRHGLFIPLATCLLVVLNMTQWTCRSDAVGGWSHPAPIKDQSRGRRWFYSRRPWKCSTHSRLQSVQSRNTAQMAWCVSADMRVWCVCVVEGRQIANTGMPIIKHDCWHSSCFFPPQ